MSTWNPSPDATKAIANANAAVGAGAGLVGFCEKFTRTCFGFTARYASAKLAYQASLAAGGIHPGDGSDAPPGSVMFWDITTGKNATYDHVAPVVATGVCASTSAGPGGTVARVRITDLTKRWGMRPLGWAHVYHGRHILTKGISEGDAEMKFSSKKGSPKQTLPKGKWVNMRFDTAGKVLTPVFGPGVFVCVLDLRLDGLKAGYAVQVKPIAVQGDSWTAIKQTWPITEIVGTSGDTFGEVVVIGDLASGQRLRFQVQSINAAEGLTLTRAEARVAY